MLFNGLRLLGNELAADAGPGCTSQADLGANVDLKAYVVRGKEFKIIRGSVVFVLFAAVALIAIAPFYLNAAFASVISSSSR